MLPGCFSCIRYPSAQAEIALLSVFPASQLGWYGDVFPTLQLLAPHPKI